MGTVKEIRGNYLTVAGVKSFNNGDGVCYLDENGKLQGFPHQQGGEQQALSAGDASYQASHAALP